MDSSLISVLSNLGTGGIVIILIILGYLVPKPSYTRVVEESARKDEVIEHLQQALALERQQADALAQAGDGDEPAHQRPGPARRRPPGRGLP